MIFGGAQRHPPVHQETPEDYISFFLFKKKILLKFDFGGNLHIIFYKNFFTKLLNNLAFFLIAISDWDFSRPDSGLINRKRD